MNYTYKGKALTLNIALYWDKKHITYSKSFNFVYKLSDIIIKIFNAEYNVLQVFEDCLKSKESILSTQDNMSGVSTS